MNRFFPGTAVVLALSGLALAQEPLDEESLRLYWILPSVLLAPDTDAESALAEPNEVRGKTLRLLLWARVEYMSEWDGGAQALLYLIEYLPLKSSIVSLQGEPLDGNAVMIFFPISLPAPASSWAPHRFGLPNAMAGVGLHDPSIGSKDALDDLDSGTEHSGYVPPAHDTEIDLGKSISFTADFRDQLSEDNILPEEDRLDWDYLKITGGINIRF